jgi:hypothetical protein
LQLDRTLPVESVDFKVSSPVAESPLKVKEVETWEVTPLAVVVQVVVNVQEDESAPLVQPGPPASAKPKSPPPIVISLPVIDSSLLTMIV